MTAGPGLRGADAGAAERFRALVAAGLGLAFGEADAGRLGDVLHRRAARHGLHIAEYLDRLADRSTAGDLAGEFTALAEELTIAETYFFRHPEQIRALADVALPQRMRERRDDRRLRLLSVGCASGEEAYTLAMVALATVPVPQWDVLVRGLDANASTLRTAAVARYSTWSLRDTPPWARRQWFRPRGALLEVTEPVRQRVEFVHHNVVEDHPTLWRTGEHDVIFCRNVLMYLTPEAKHRLLARMIDALAPGGYLFLGHTDTLGSGPASLRLCQTGDAFFYQRAAVGPAPQPRADERHAERPAALAAPAAHTPAAPDARAARPGSAWSQPTRDVLRAMQEERYAEALATAQELVDGDLAADRDPALPLLWAVLLAQTGEVARAEAGCRRVLAAGAFDADAHYLHGMCLEEADAGAAAASYGLAAKLDSGFAMPHLRLGALAGRRADRRTAERELRRAIRLLPGERPERVVMFGGGFGRRALIEFCHAQLSAAGSRR